MAETHTNQTPTNPEENSAEVTALGGNALSKQEEAILDAVKSIREARVAKREADDVLDQLSYYYGVDAEGDIEESNWDGWKYDQLEAYAQELEAIRDSNIDLISQKKEELSRLIKDL